MNPGWKKLKSKILFQTPRWEVRQDEVIKPGNGRSTYEYIARHDFASVIGKDKKGRFVVVKQWRYLIDQNTWEFPRGSAEVGETPLASAKREFEEETGYKAKKWQLLGASYLANSITPQKYYVYLATDLFTGRQALEETEVGLEVKTFSLREIKKMIATGKIDDSVTITSLYYYLAMKKK